MPDARLRLTVIIGSVREGRFGPVAARWFAEEARRHNRFAVEVVDLARHALPLALPNGSPKAADYPRPAEMADLTATLERSDAFVLVTPEYNHSFPASIKSLIDWHFTQWQAKPVGFVSYGGVAGGLHAVEQLRLVFSEVHAVTMRDTVSFHRFPQLFDENGGLRDPDGPAGAAKVLLDQLAWWATALHNARAATPYGTAG